MLIRLHEMSKKIVPEIIHPPAQNHAAAGKSHDLPDLGPAIPAVTVDRAFFAGGFRRERTFAPLCQGMPGQFRTFTAKQCLSHCYVFNLNIRFDLITMFCPAVYPDEVEQEFQVFNLRVGKLFHRCMVAEKANESYDAGQKMPFPSSLCFSRRDMLR